jgi:PhnB protein
VTLPGVPEGYRTVSPYLIVSDADAAAGFVAEVFGAVVRRRMPGEAGGLHCELEVGDSVVMIGSGGGMSFPGIVHVYVEDSDEVYSRALGLGATSAAEPHDTSFGDHRSAFDDPWGNQWWVATRISGGEGAPAAA